MASRYFLVLIAIALVPFAVARQNPSDKKTSSTDLTQKDGLYEPLGLPSTGLPPITPPKLPCWKKPGTSDGTDEYEPSGLDKIFCPPPPAPVPSTAPTPAPTPTSPAPIPTSPAPTPTSPAPTPTSPAPTPSSPVPTTSPVPAPAPTA